MTDTKSFESFGDRLINHLRSQQETLNISNDSFADLALTIYSFEQAERDSRKVNRKPGEMSWGKFKGKQLTDIYKLDPKYCLWLSKNCEYLSAENKDILTHLISV